MVASVRRAVIFSRQQGFVDTTPLVVQYQYQYVSCYIVLALKKKCFPANFSSPEFNAESYTVTKNVLKN